MKTWTLLLALFPAAVQESKDPAEVLRTLEEDLRKAITNSGKNKDTRKKLTALAKSSFDGDIRASAPKVPKGVWEYHDDFLGRLAVADVHFRHEDDRAERTIWFAGCRSAFSRQIAGSKEAAAGVEAPSTDQLYLDFRDAVAKVGKRFAPGAVDYDKAGYEAAREAFNALIQKARAPGGDPKLAYAKALSDIDRVYPINTDDLKKANTQRHQMLTAAAKAVLDRALTAPK